MTNTKLFLEAFDVVSATRPTCNSTVGFLLHTTCKSEVDFSPSKLYDDPSDENEAFIVTCQNCGVLATLITPRPDEG